MKSVLLLGAGGHACVVLDLLNVIGHKVAGYLAPAPSSLPHNWLGSDERLSDYSPHEYQLVLAVGSVGVSQVRRQLFCKGKENGFDFLTLVHPFSYVAADVQLGEGVQIMAGAVVQTGGQLGQNVLINTCASIDHHAQIGADCHLAPGVRLSGGVTLAAGCHIGPGAVLIQGISLGANSLVAAGAVVTESWPVSSCLKGVPARPF